MIRTKPIAIVLSLLAALTCRAHALDADEILARVDERRAVAPSFRFTIRIDDYERGMLAQSATMSGSAKGMNKTLVRYEEPASMRGKKLLMVDDETFFFAPRTKRPVRLTASQRLLGQASNGDVMNVRFRCDYSPRIAREETADTADGPVRCIVLELAAKRKGSAYASMTLWVSETGYFPVKAECFAASGKLLKTAEYSNIRVIGGKEVVTKTTLRDTIARDSRTVIEFTDMTAEEIPDAFFSKDYLMRM